MGKVFKNPKFLIGFSFVAMLFLVSVFYGIFFGDRIPKMEIFINDNGDPVRPVYSPIEYPPFGTNTHGEPMLNVILVGAKYTIAFALIITILRFVFSASIGVLLETYFPKVMKLFSKPVDAFHYFPLTLLSYFLLEWVLFSDRLMDGTFTYSFADRVLIETIVLVVVALPITTQLIASETRLIYHREFMEGAKVIGGSRWHILKKHVRPFLVPQFFIIFATELIQVLLLMAHLGVLGIFLGGGMLQQDLFFGDDPDTVSFSKEWSGLIGADFKYLRFDYRWIPFIPIVCFTVTIIAIKLTVEGMKEVFTDIELYGKKGHDKEEEGYENREEISEQDFEIINR